MHSAFAMLLALRQRERTGRGSFLEVSMVESALNAVAEQVVEYTAYGTVLERLGNRSRDAAPQGVYPAAGHEQWLAISVATDDQWRALKRVLGDPAWAADPALETHEGRWAAHDVLDKHLEDWSRGRDPRSAADELIEHGVPAAEVRDARAIRSHPQLAHRGYFEELDHPIVGPHVVPDFPFRFASIDRWYESAAPMLGEHNETILRDLLGRTKSDIERLEAEAVIGTTPVGLD
jgi:crotonobetainyl-CoA:carnitine CoA-transferase CaiB-like acyl-CoA transferase